MPLAKYRSHKIVEAAKITGVFDQPLRWILDGGPDQIEVSQQLAERVPVTDGERLAFGGYYVRYADGFESWSPAAAFEEGYSRV